MPTTALLAAGIVNPKLKADLQAFMDAVPPVYVLAVAGGFALLALVLRYRYARGLWVWSSAAISVLAAITFAVYLLIGMFFGLHGREKRGDSRATQAVLRESHPCRSKSDCPKGLLCTTVADERRCRAPCSKALACPPGLSCVAPAEGSRVCAVHASKR